MPRLRLPLVGMNAPRNPDAFNNMTNDSRYVNCVFKVLPNPITRQMEVWCEKRAGLGAGTSIDGTNTGNAIYGFNNSGTLVIYSTFQTIANARVFQGSTLIGISNNCGVLGANWGLAQIREIQLGATRYLFFTFPKNTEAIAGKDDAYYFDTTVNPATTTFTADTNTNTSLTNVSSTTNLRVGQRISGTDIPGNTRITAISGTTVTMNNAATGSTGGVTVTQEHLSRIMSANFPAEVTGPFCQINGRLYILDLVNNRIYQSALNDPQTWGASDYITLDAVADLSVGLNCINNRVYGFGQSSIEVFNYVFNASGTQLSRVGVIQRGTQYRTISASASIEGRLYFIAFEGGVYEIQEGGVKRISTDFLDALMASSSAQGGSNGGALLDAFFYDGRPFLQLSGATWSGTFTPTHQYTFWYDVQNNAWTQQVFTISSVDRLVRFNSDYALRQTHAIAFAGLGNTYSISYSSPVYTDAAGTMTMTIQTNRSDLGTINRKFIKSIGLVQDRQSDGTVTLSYSDDDGSTFTVHPSTFDKTNPQIRIYRVGSHTGGRIYRLTDSHNSAFRGQALDIEYEVGSH